MAKRDGEDSIAQPAPTAGCSFAPQRRFIPPDGCEGRENPMPWRSLRGSSSTQHPHKVAQVWLPRERVWWWEPGAVGPAGSPFLLPRPLEVPLS